MSYSTINPATGLPMIDDGYGGVDVGGSPYGTDIHAHHHPWSASYPAWDCGGWGGF
ncbi:peptidase [Burkholderia cenocepacia]